MGRSSLIATGALSFFLGGSVSGQESCVQVAYPTWGTNCPCEAGSQYSFTMEGQTTVTANTVNVAVIIDASNSVGTADWELSKEFAKNTVASFAEQNLFTNGGSASFAQFSSSASEGGTFYSLQDFNAFVDADAKYTGTTNIIDGITKGRELLSASPTATSFMIVTTDGEAPDPQDEADAARAEGTILYAVGVGLGPSQENLLAIGGDEANVFDVDNFEELDLALEDIVSASGSSVPCAATGATVTVQFNGMVTEATVDGGVATYDGGDVVFTVDDLEATPTNFEVWLDWCGQPEGGEIIASVSYADDEGNTPDLSALEGWAVVPYCDDDAAPSPVSPKTPAPSFATPATPVPAAPVRDSPDDVFDDLSFDFSYSYSYTYDPWYDDDRRDAPTAPGPAPHDGGRGSPTPEDAPTHRGDAPVYSAPTGGGRSPTPGAAPTHPEPAPTHRGDAPVYSAPTGGGRSPTPGAAPTHPEPAPTHRGEAPVYSAPTGGGRSPTPGAAPTHPEPAPTHRGDAPVYTPPSYTAPSPAPGPHRAPTSDMQRCSNGVYGIESPNGKACCALTCGSCGGVGCSRRPGGSFDCCESEIVEEGEACAATGASPCYIDGDEVVDPVVPTEEPVTPGGGGGGGGRGGGGNDYTPTNEPTDEPTYEPTDEPTDAPVTPGGGGGRGGGGGGRGGGGRGGGGGDGSFSYDYNPTDEPTDAPVTPGGGGGRGGGGGGRGGGGRGGGGGDGSFSYDFYPTDEPTDAPVTPGGGGGRGGGGGGRGGGGRGGGGGDGSFSYDFYPTDEPTEAPVTPGGGGGGGGGGGRGGGGRGGGGGDDGGGDDGEVYSYDYGWEADINDQFMLKGQFMWCTNGVPGVESTRGDVCCPASCGHCGGVGCDERGAADECCTTEIMDYGQPCSVTGTAPCYLDG